MERRQVEEVGALVNLPFTEEKKRKIEERKEAKEKRERDVQIQTGRQGRRQRERVETPAVRDRLALTEGREQGSHSHSCHNLK